MNRLKFIIALAFNLDCVLEATDKNTDAQASSNSISGDEAWASVFFKYSVLALGVFNFQHS